MYKDNLINNLPKCYRKDKWVNELYKSAGIELDNVNISIEDLQKQFWFDTMTWAMPIYEKLLSIKTNPNAQIEDRRSYIEAKWKSSGKCTLQLIQAVANSFYGGKTQVTFPDGKINVKFVDIGGVPRDLDSFKQAIEDLKPAHLPLIFTYAYLIWDLWDSWDMTWDEFESKNLTWDELETTVTRP